MNRNYVLGILLIVVSVASFAFLGGSTAVFVGLAAAIAGAVAIVMGIQADEPETDPMLIAYEGTDQQPDGFDWDAHYKREFGDEQGGPHTAR